LIARRKRESYFGKITTLTCQQLATSWVNNTQTRTQTSQVTSNSLINSVRNLTVSLPLKDNGWRLNYSPFSYQIASSTPQVNKRLSHAASRTSLLLPLYSFMPHFSLNTTPKDEKCVSMNASVVVTPFSFRKSKRSDGRTKCMVYSIDSRQGELKTLTPGPRTTHWPQLRGLPYGLLRGLPYGLPSIIDQIYFYLPALPTRS